MKAGTIALSLLAAATAHCTANAAPAKIGASLDYYEAMRCYEINGSDITEHYDAAGASIITDLTYLRLGLGFVHSFGNMIIFTDDGEAKDPDYRLAFVQASALGKYPFELGEGSVNLWPAMGLGFDMNWRNEYQGAAEAQLDPSPSDLQALLGGGIDYAFAEDWAVTGALLGWYSLTPSAADAADSPMAFGVSLNAGVLLSL